MSLEHALLVSLRERPGTGIELARRFDRTVGFFWQATHQQIYRVLRRMESDGWLTAGAGSGRSTERRYAVTGTGEAELARWIAEPTEPAPLRSEVAVKLRGAAYGDRAALLEQLRSLRLEHQARLARYEQLEREQFPDPTTLDGHALDVWLVLRGGVRQEQYWVDWLTDYLDAWGAPFVARSARTSGSDSATSARTSGSDSATSARTSGSESTTSARTSGSDSATSARTSGSESTDHLLPEEPARNERASRGAAPRPGRTEDER